MLALEFPTSNDWYIQKEQTQYGPYSYVEVLKFMQQKVVFDFDYAWSPHLESWTPFGELPEFSAERILRLVEKNSSSGVFHKREHDRFFCDTKVVIHNQKQTWNGTIKSIGLGGALIKIENPLLNIGEKIFIHFDSTDEQQAPFNCAAEVLNKKHTRARIRHNSGILYAIKFVQMTDEGKKELRKRFKEAKNNDFNKGV
jgi:hypothetical protein